jgi:predicted transcriptional regulator of viral defense system
MKTPKTKLGSLEMQLLSYAQMRKKDILALGELAPVLGITQKQERELFSRLSRTGMIIRLTKGVYLVPSQIPSGGRWTVSGYYLLARLMEVLKGRYQISGPYAFQFYGFDDQVPNRIFVYNDRLFGEREVGGTQFVFIKTEAKRLGSTKNFKTPDGPPAVMVTKSRALVDAVYDWSRFNTLPKAYGWIKVALTKEPALADKLITDTLQYSNKGTLKRMGYLLAQLGIAEEQLKKIKRRLGPIRSFIPWIPSQAAKGTVDREWGLIVNGTILQT